MGKRLIELLETTQPQFHLKSLTRDVPNAENFFFQKGATTTSDLKRTSYSIGKEVLLYLSSILQPDFVTLETGAGYSTVLFAAHARKHLCVNPDITSNQLIKTWLTDNGYSCDPLFFIEESSATGLAKLIDREKVDVALIDGCHSFPFPMIDWHFINLLLAPGGKLLIDDTPITTVKILCDFLSLETSYKYLTTIDRCTVFEKRCDSIEIGWLNQEINRRHFTLAEDTSPSKPPKTLKQNLKNGLRAAVPSKLYTLLRSYYRKF